MHIFVILIQYRYFGTWSGTESSVFLTFQNQEAAYSNLAKLVCQDHNNALDK